MVKPYVIGSKLYKTYVKLYEGRGGSYGVEEESYEIKLYKLYSYARLD